MNDPHLLNCPLNYQSN